MSRLTVKTEERMCTSGPRDPLGETLRPGREPLAACGSCFKKQVLPPGGPSSWSVSSQFYKKILSTALFLLAHTQTGMVLTFKLSSLMSRPLQPPRQCSPCCCNKTLPKTCLYSVSPILPSLLTILKGFCSRHSTETAFKTGAIDFYSRCPGHSVSVPGRGTSSCPCAWDFLRF